MQREFRDAMSRLGAAVTVLTTDGPAGRHGMTASAVCSVTDTPPTLLVCVNRSNRSHAAFRANGVICVNVLAGRHRELSGLFSRPGAADRFAGTGWTSGATGAPVLKDAAVSFDCRISACHEEGTHSVLFCAVEAMEMGPGAPEGLIWFGRDYHHLRAAV